MDTAIEQIKITDEFVRKRPLSKSSLKAFREAPKNYIEYLRTPYEEKDEFVVGKAAEAMALDLALGSNTFGNGFEVYEKFARRSNADKERWKIMLDEAKEAKKVLIDSDNYHLSMKMAENAMANEECRYYLERAQNVQRKLSWTDKKTGLPVIGFIDFDVNIEDHIIIVDMKTDYNGEPDHWFRHAADLEYDLQVGVYLTGYHKIDYQFPDFMFLVMEKRPPQNAYMVHCPGNYCNDAKREFLQTLVAFRYCMDEDKFHMGYDFWLFDTLPYFTMRKPRYKRSKFAR
jgi:hypothetical protein